MASKSYPPNHLAVGHTSPTSGLVAFETPTVPPAADEALIRVQWVVVSAFDVWHNDFSLGITQYPVPLGIDLGGEVVEAGSDTDLKPGDKVFSFSFTPTAEGKAFQEYATISKWCLGKLPPNVPLEEAITVPDNVVTVFWSLFGPNLNLPLPSDFPARTSPPDAQAPIVIWGASGSVGQYALQVLAIAGYKKVFGVASARHHDYLKSLGATSTFDYRSPDVVEQILKEAGGKVKYVFDTIGDESGSLALAAKLAGEGSKIAYLIPIRVNGEDGVRLKESTDVQFPENSEAVGVRTFLYQTDPTFKEQLQPIIIPKLLEDGLIKPNRIRRIDGSTLLEGVEKALDILRRGQVSGERLVVQV